MRYTDPHVESLSSAKTAQVGENNNSTSTDTHETYALTQCKQLVFFRDFSLMQVFTLRYVQRDAGEKMKQPEPYVGYSLSRVRQSSRASHFTPLQPFFCVLTSCSLFLSSHSSAIPSAF